MSRSAGRSIVAAAAYRSGTRLLEERTGQTHDYTRKRVEHAEIMAPAGAPAWVFDRQALWNAVDAAEKRKDAQLAREIEVALPRELSPEARLALVREFTRREFVGQGMVADLAVHNPKARDGGQQPHAHILLTMRPLEGGHFGKKQRAWNDVGQLEAWRLKWAEAANQALERTASPERIDHRTLAAQGIDREPEPKLGITHRLARRAGETLDRLNQWIAVRHRNRVRDHLAAMQAIDPIEFAEMIGAQIGRQADRARQLARMPSPRGPELDR